MKIICISGHAQVGKDTTASILKPMLEADGYRVLITHYGDLLKHICKSFFDWNGEKDESGRGLLQYIGSDVIRRQKPDFWVGFIADILEMFGDRWDCVLIPDVRFPNEIDYLKQRGFDVTHLRVLRPGFESPLTKEQQNHPSETALDKVLPDAYIPNGGTLDDLQEMLSYLVTQTNGWHQLCIGETGTRGSEESLWTHIIPRKSTI